MLQNTSKIEKMLVFDIFNITFSGLSIPPLEPFHSPQGGNSPLVKNPCCISKASRGAMNNVKWSEVVAVGQNLRSISTQAGLELLNVLVTLTLSHRSFNYDTDHGRVWITLGDRHCGLETFMLGSRSEPMQSNITACSTGQSANHLHHRGDDVTNRDFVSKSLCVKVTKGF